MPSMLRALLPIALLTTLALAGPEWQEDEDGGEDAGATPGSAQTTAGIGGMQRISGQLQGLFGGTAAPLAAASGPIPDDFQDVYVICIDDPEAFRASTCDLDGFAEFDARLYLFSLDGLGIVGNNTPMPAVWLAGEGSCSGAVLENVATDQTGSQVIASGLYLLAITTAPFTPRDANGDPIFFFEVPDEISGPDGPGGGNPLGEWQPGTGACCLQGSCVSLSEDDCVSQEGEFLGEDVSCDDVDCVEPVGACFIETAFGGGGGGGGGECVETTALDCAGLGGEYAGDGTTCPPVGACLVSGKGPLECFVTTEAECGQIGYGEYLGDGVPCPPIGACFFGKGYCSITTAAECDDLRGSFQGDGSTCGFFGLGDAGGAGERAPATAAAVGVAVEARGGRSTPVLGSGDTPGADGEYRILLTGVCFATAVPTGACELPGGSCVETTEFECLRDTGAYQGDGTTCATLYRLHNHPDGSTAPPLYGLRLDELWDYALPHDVFSFDFDAPGAEMYLALSDDQIHIWGTAFGGRDRGLGFDPLQSGWVEIDFVYDVGVGPAPGDDDVIVTGPDGANGGSLSFTNFAAGATFPFFDYSGDFDFTFRFGDEDDDLGHRGAPGLSGWGWLVHPAPDSAYILSSDWLFTAEPVTQ